jgi:hypothetical protein
LQLADAASQGSCPAASSTSNNQHLLLEAAVGCCWDRPATLPPPQAQSSQSGSAPPLTASSGWADCCASGWPPMPALRWALSCGSAIRSAISCACATLRSLPPSPCSPLSSSARLRRSLKLSAQHFKRRTSMPMLYGTTELGTSGNGESLSEAVREQQCT